MNVLANVQFNFFPCKRTHFHATLKIYRLFLSMTYRLRLFSLSVLSVVLFSGCGSAAPQGAPVIPVIPPPATTTVMDLPMLSDAQLTATTTGFGAGINYQAPTATINPAIAADFDINTIKNLHDMETAYGFVFSPAELSYLAKNKFVEKNIMDTTIRPYSGGDNVREFSQLYAQVKGSTDIKQRGPQNALFYSSDVFFNSYNNLYTQLLKEMENTQFYPGMKSMTKAFYTDAVKHLDAATTYAEKAKWTKVRNYFVVPYAIFENVGQTLASDDYMKGGEMVDPNKVMADYAAADGKKDTYEKVSAFVKALQLDASSEKAVLSDLKQIYDPKDAQIPAVFADEYEAYARQENVTFNVDFTQFTPRGSYTSSSLRRQYFRGLKWYIMLPFFVKSQPLTTYSFAITQLMAENPSAFKSYDKLESTIDFLVGSSDDLMPVDYLQALAAGKGSSDPAKLAMDSLVKARNPMIKDLAAQYPTSGTVSSADVLLKTKGMRFFSGKFIIDSYWTGFMTQGDEAIRPGYSQKLPPMASSLEVMTLLGSDYARTQIPKLDFYSPSTSVALDQALQELKAQNATLTEADWSKNIYMGWLRTIKSLFTWQHDNKDRLPAFMHSVAWEAKTLMTATAWWTELRHATILYAKQSFAEMGAGGDDSCDTRKIPAPPKAYIEPQLEAYARLSFLSKRTYEGLKEMGFELNNLYRLERFIRLMDKVQVYTQKELGNTTLHEATMATSRPDPTDPKKTCTEYALKDASDWEALRLGLTEDLEASIPTPVEGPVLDAKDRRTALVADVHTGGDSLNPTKILYEGVGVPSVIFTAVNDANGPRLTVGFVSSQYEFTEAYGGKRLTDEAWQTHFYDGTDPYNAYAYTDKKTWPQQNPWYAPLNVK